MNDDPGPCPSAAEIEAIASGVSGEPALREHVRLCGPCRELIESAKFEHQFAAAVNAGAKNAAMAEMPKPSLPGYEIVREVSRGGQGIVYEAIQTRTRRRVALKVLRQDHGISRSQRARFDREIEIAAALKHQGIVGVYDSIAMPGGRHALVLEFVEGEALDRHNLEAGSDGKSARNAVELMAKVCDAIHYAHQRGVIHRDLKPSNILVDASGQPRVLDFGVACWFGAPGADAARITLTGEFAGTLAYAAPEQVSGVAGAPDLRSDLYALGVMLYQLCFGGLPYDVNGPLDSAIRNIIESSPTRTRGGHGAAVDEDLWVIINKALSKEPDRRYQSAAAMGADLRRYLSGETIEARRDSRMYVLRKTISRHRYATGAGVAAFVGLAAFGLVVEWNNAKLTEALRTSTFERAKALGAAGSRPEADLLLWPEILGLGPALREPAKAMFGGTPHEKKILWAFAEMQGATPCISTAVTAENSRVVLDCNTEKVVSMDGQGQFAEWSIPDLRPMNHRHGDDRTVLDRSISVAGNWCVRFDRGDLVCVDSVSGRELSRRVFVDEPRVSLKMNRKGSILAATSAACGVSVFELPSLQPIFQHASRMSTSYPWLSESGDRIALAEDDQEVVLYHLPDGKRLLTVPLQSDLASRQRDHIAGFQTLAISEDGERMVVVAGHHMLLGRTEDQENRLYQSVTVGSVASPLISPTGNWLLTRADSDPLVKLWRTSDWTQVASYPGHFGEASGGLITPDERHIVTSDSAGVLRVWAGPRAEAIRNLPDSSVKPHDVAIDASGRTIWAASSDGRVGRWPLDGSSPSEFLTVDPKTAFSVAFSRQSGMLAAGGENGRVCLFNADSVQNRVLDAVASEGISSVRFSPDGRLLAACGRYGPIAIYDTRTWARIRTIETSVGRIVMARWSPDGKMLAIAGGSLTGTPDSQGVCETYQTESFQLFKRWDAHPVACRTVEFSPDGRLLVTGGKNGVVRFYNAESFEPIREMHLNNSTVFSLAFHERGNVLAVGDRSGRVTVVGWPEAKVLAHFDMESSIMAIEFAGDQLAVAQLDHSITVRDFGMVARCITGNMDFWESRLKEQSKGE